MKSLSIRAQLVLGAVVILAIITSMWFYSARQTYSEQVRILGQQMPIVARTLADTLTPGEDSPEKIARVLAGLQVTPDSAAIIADRDGHVVAFSGPESAIAGRDLRRMARLTRTLDADGIERAWGVEHRRDGSVSAAVARPTRIAWDRAVPIYRRNFAVVVVASLLVLSVLSITVVLATRGMRQLHDMTVRVSNGDLSAPPMFAMPSSELDQLQTTMVEMIARLSELQRQVVRQERLAAIGTLVSGVAHEINNPLQSILGHVEVLQERTDLPAAVRSDLAVIQHESTRAGTIIRNLTRFTRQQPVGPAPVRLTEIVHWLCDLWRRRLEEQGIALDVDERSTGQVDVVATELQQVALNFLVNAEYAVLRSERRPRRVTVRTSDLPNGSVRFEVDDTGPGVAPADESLLFQPFFTTKPVGDGTGLGLSVSYGIIQSYGGRIGYDRTPDGGARFYFEIPASRTES